MNDAVLLCFPSACESFGLPVLEAMASGTAVVCSNLPCFRELYGDCVRYCDTYSALDYARAIEDLLKNPEKRLAMEQAGRERARELSWENCVRKTMSVYEELTK